MSELNKELPVLFGTEAQGAVALKPDHKALKKAEDKAIARMHQQFNGRVMRVKTKLLSEAGVQIEKYGIRRIGHGRVFFGGENADGMFSKIDDDIEKFMAADPPVNPEVITELRTLQLRANRQIIETGKLHLEAAKEAAAAGNRGLQIAFPQGQPGQSVKVAIVQEGEEPKALGNDKEKTLTQGEAST